MRTSQAPSANLADDSLGWSLLLAARVLAQVRAGKSLTEALRLLQNEAPMAKAAAQDVAYGVLRRYGWGEFILSQLLQKPLSHEETQSLLLAALYRLDTRADAVAMVVDQAVIAAGELSGGVFKGLVNGVLRNFLRQRGVLDKAVRSNDEAAYAHPRWWLTRLRRAYPQQWTQIIAANNKQAPMCLRVNTRLNSRDEYAEKLNAAGFSSRPVGAQALILDKSAPVDALPGFFAGLVSVQDAGAQRAAELLLKGIDSQATSGARVLDACAAPGGKTAHLLELAELDLLALDLDCARAQRISDNLQRLNLSATVKTADCVALDTWWDGHQFDLILADVPCSASGVVRRHPDIKTLRRESDIRHFVHTQAAILDALWTTLKPGGRLLYATCSLFPEENVGQIDAFLIRAPSAQRLNEEQWLPQEDHDGFYYALLQKQI